MKAKVNLAKSSYKTQFANYEFYFSSKENKYKFQKRLLKYVDKNEHKINNKYSVELNLSLYLAISLYKKIEKEGFFVVSKDGTVVRENVGFVTAIINW